MSNPVKKYNHPISADTRSLISTRYQTLTKAINESFWDSDSKTAHSRYVGSYGRGTAISVSDLDVLFELPDSEYDHFTNIAGNGPSRLLQAVKSAVLDRYPRTDVKGDGQVVVIKFSDGMKFEILPAFKNYNWFGQWDGTYKYPDSHMGGNWLSTNPLAEQEAIARKNSTEKSNGLLVDTCKHIRYIRANFFSSYHLSGILIDSFVYAAIGGWRFTPPGEEPRDSDKTYEEVLLDCYNSYFHYAGFVSPAILAPGSMQQVATDDWGALGKVLQQMV